MNLIQRQNNSNLTIYFYLSHVKREEIEPLIQFLHKFNLDFHRINNKEPLWMKLAPLATDFIRKNSNHIARSSKLISFEEFTTINKFLEKNHETIVVGYEYGNLIWNASRTKMETPFGAKAHSSYDIFKGIGF